MQSYTKCRQYLKYHGNNNYMWNGIKGYKICDWKELSILSVQAVFKTWQYDIKLLLHHEIFVHGLWSWNNWMTTLCPNPNLKLRFYFSTTPRHNHKRQGGRQMHYHNSTRLCKCLCPSLMPVKECQWGRLFFWQSILNVITCRCKTVFPIHHNHSKPYKILILNISY